MPHRPGIIILFHDVPLATPTPSPAPANEVKLSAPGNGDLSVAQVISVGKTQGTYIVHVWSGNPNEVVRETYDTTNANLEPSPSGQILGP